MAVAGVPWAAPRALPATSMLRQVGWFAAIGVVSTAAYAALYAGLRLVLDPAASNALALLVTAVGNTAANRRLTFGVRDRSGALRDQAGGLLALGVALVITTAAVVVLGAVAPDAGWAVELAVLVAANALATVCRFLVLRRWIAGPRPAGGGRRRDASQAEPSHASAAGRPAPSTHPHPAFVAQSRPASVAEPCPADVAGHPGVLA
jgi:putative flippase GtrA